MDGRIRRKLETGMRVQLFSREHPADGPGYTETVARLDARISRAQELVAEQQIGFVEAQASTASKAALRETIREDHLKHLVRIARGAAEGDAQLSMLFRLPKANANGATFLGQARALAERAAEHREIFIRDGMPATFVDDLRQALGRYEAAGSQRSLGTALHIGARAELKAVLDEVGLLVRRLDGINRFHFRDEPEVLAVWSHVRRVSWPASRKESGTPGGGGTTSAA